MWLLENPLLWHVCFIWSELFVIIYSYNDKLPVTLIFITMNLSLKVLHFFQQYIYIYMINMERKIRVSAGIWTSDLQFYTLVLYYWATWDTYTNSETNFSPIHISIQDSRECKVILYYNSILRVTQQVGILFGLILKILYIYGHIEGLLSK